MIVLTLLLLGCGGGVAPDCDALAFYEDTDGDGFGNPRAEVLSCERPTGATSDATDCDDSSSAVRPGAAEKCNDFDDDCDGLIDDADDTLDPETVPTWYEDVDLDGYGSDDAVPLSACDGPSGYAEEAGDCDDYANAVNPGEAEVCDGVDNDCDGLEDDDDDGLDTTTATGWFLDADSDGHGDPDAAPALACEIPSGYSEVADDCDDSDAAVHPDATEACNGVDDDCDLARDEDDACDCTLKTGHDEAGLYLFCTDVATWADARSACQGWGYDLLVVQTAEEDDWAFSAAVTLEASEPWWMALVEVSEGSWAWADGAPLSHEHWGVTAGGASEPDDDGGIGADCGELNSYGDGSWDDGVCALTHPYICELPPYDPPDPE